jgi:hypothetical protein
VAPGAERPLTPDEQAAASALAADAGSLPARAEVLVRAVAQVAAEEAVAVIAGTANVGGGVLDTRVARLKRLVDALPATEAIPDVYEVGVIFRITVAQARNVIRTYQARYSTAYRKRQETRLKEAIAYARNIANREVWVIEFGDPDALDYGYELLRRRGLTKSLERDRAAQTLTMLRDQKDRSGKTAVEVLGCKRR